MALKQSKLDENCIWYPFTQMKTDSIPLKVISGAGAVLELEDGRQLIDCVSSWWVNIHGHGHPKISAAIYEQALRLEHVIFAGFTHDPAEKIAKKLVQLLPATLKKVFFSDNGSTAVEVALKQAYQYWRNRGEEGRCSFLCFEGGYHGDTIGAMSLGSRSIFNKVFEDLLFETVTVPYPATFPQDQDVEEKERLVLVALEKELSKKPCPFAAVVIEPLVQGVGGMQMCRSEFLVKLQHLVHSYQTLLVYDEVMTGFGRTGDWFACTKSGTQPDIICLAKGLTGGFLPLAVTVCSDEIYHAFYSTDMTKTLFHGHSYTANPLGCAAAIASLELLEENESLFKGMEARHRAHLVALETHPRLENVRICGSIVAMDIVVPSGPGYLNTISHKMRTLFLEEGLLMRPLGNVLYLILPYCVTDIQLAQVYEGIKKVLMKL